MSFQNLEARFNEKVSELYAGAKTKFEGGRPSNGANDDPLIVRSPNNGYWTAAEGRGTPVSSAIIDTRRLTLFTISTRGIAFLAKQQLLQTGNTFESQRLINPAFVIGNAVPFLRIKRSLDVPITLRGIGRQLLGSGAIANLIFGKGTPAASRENLLAIGQLQTETYNRVKNSPLKVTGLINKIPVVGKIFSAVNAKRSMGDRGPGWEYSRPELGTKDSEYFVSLFTPKKIELGTLGGLLFTPLPVITFPSAKSGFEFGGTPTTPLFSKWNYGFISTGKDPITYLSIKGIDVPQQLVAEGYKNSVPTAPPFNDGSYPLSDNTLLNNETSRQEKLSSAGSDRLLQKRIDDNLLLQKTQRKQYIDRAYTDAKIYDSNANPNEVNYIKYFRSKEMVGAIQETTPDEVIDGTQGNAKELANVFYGNRTGKRLSYIRDPMNSFARVTLDGAPARKIQPQYEGLPAAGFEDAITVSFAMGNNDHVQFRAFIKDLQQSASPEYKDYQYIGRIEKFVSYISVRREVSFKLGILAFSQDELDMVWTRINYLTGMAFPFGIDRGILQPNIIRMTLGNVYTNQPAYITALNTSFNEPTETWDIGFDKQVPISATMDMRFNLIEKTAATATSPFYGIVEQLERFTTAASVETTNTVTGNSSNSQPQDEPIARVPIETRGYNPAPGQTGA